MGLVDMLVPLRVDPSKKRDPLNWCPTCRLRHNCLTVVVNANGHNQGPLMPSIAVAHCTVYQEEEGVGTTDSHMLVVTHGGERHA